MKDAPPDILENWQWLHPPGTGMGYTSWVCILVGVLVLAGTAWYFIRRKKLGLSAFAPPPHHAALRALEALQKRISEENQREFVVEVSLILRTYVQARFGLRAPHRSTEEFLKEVVSDPLLVDHRDLLGSFLKRCDLVKFAKGSVLMDEMRGLLESARQFVEATIPSGQTRPAADG